jgi:hypothetical protein
MEVTMDKAGKPFFPSYAERSLLNSAFAKAYSEPELSEIISGAVGMCGFVNPIEAQDVIDVVLEVIQTEHPIQPSP